MELFEVAEASRQVGTRDVDLARLFRLHSTRHGLEILRDEGGVQAHGLQRARHDPLRF